MLRTTSYPVQQHERFNSLIPSLGWEQRRNSVFHCLIGRIDWQQPVSMARSMQSADGMKWAFSQTMKNIAPSTPAVIVNFRLCSSERYPLTRFASDVDLWLIIHSSSATYVENRSGQLYLEKSTRQQRSISHYIWIFPAGTRCQNACHVKQNLFSSASSWLKISREVKKVPNSVRCTLPDVCVLYT